MYLLPRTSSHGGGVGILVHEDLSFPSISPIILSYIDCISCKFNLQSNSLRIIVIYRPPKPYFSTFSGEFSDLINDCLHHNEYNIMIVGEFNYHFDPHSQSHSLFDRISLFTSTSKTILFMLVLTF